MNLFKQILPGVSFATLGIIVSLLPLVGDFHVETAQIGGLLFAITGALLASRLHSPNRIKDDATKASHYQTGLLKGESLRSVFLETAFLMGSFLLPIFIASILRGCLSVDGVLIVALIAPTSGILGISIGVFFSTHLRKYNKRVSILVIFFLSIVPPLVILRYFPHVFLFNSVWGWFPAPIYDEQVAFSWSLAQHRISVLAASVLILSFSKKAWITSTLKNLQESSLWLMRFFAAIVYLLLILTFSSSRVLVSHGDIKKFLGGSERLGTTELIYDVSSVNEISVGHWLSWVDFNIQEIKESLDLAYNEEITIYLYRDRWQKQRYTGAKHTSYVPVWNRKAHIHIDEQSGHSVLRHELVHVLAREMAHTIPGASLSIGLTEGLAVALEDPRFIRISRDQIVAGSESTPNFNEIRRLFTPWGFYGGRSGVNYTICGSFTNYLLEHGDISLLKSAYRTGSLRGAFGPELEELFDGWLSHIKSIETDSLSMTFTRQVFGRESIFERTCARNLTRAEALIDQVQMHSARKNFAEAGRLSDKLLSLYPESQAGWSYWSYFQLISGEYLSVIESAKTHLANSSEQTYYLRLADAYVAADSLMHASRVITNYLNAYSDVTEGPLSLRGIHLAKQKSDMGGLPGFLYKDSGQAIDDVISINFEEWQLFNHLQYRVAGKMDADILNQNSSLKNLFLSRLDIKELMDDEVLLVLLHLDIDGLTWQNQLKLAEHIIFGQWYHNSKTCSYINNAERDALYNNANHAVGILKEMYHIAETEHQKNRILILKRYRDYLWERC